ncbi:EAL domain-containing protein [Colwelliaceae bacterium 6471]
MDNLSVDDGLSQGTINSILQDDAGYIWLGTESGLNIYDGYSVRVLPGPDGDFANFGVYNLMQDSAGLIWINLFGKGLYTYNTKTNQYKFILASDPNNKDYFISDYIEGDNNTLWIATSKTVGRYDQRSGEYQQILDLTSELSSKDNINRIVKSGNVLYIATRVGSFAYHIPSKKWRKLPEIKEKIAHPNAFNLVEAAKIFNLYIHNNLLYLGSNDGVFGLDVSLVEQYINKSATLPDYSLVIDNVSSWTFRADDEYLYIGSDKGLSAINTRDQSVNFLFGLSQASKNVTDDRIISLLKDKQGLFWLGSNSTGVYRWDPRREIIENYQYHQGGKVSLSNNEVWSIRQHSSHPEQLWVATSNGLNLIDMDKRHIEHFNVGSDSKNMYTSSHIYTLFEDSLHRLWLSTAKGVLLFDPQQNKIVDLPFSEQTKALLAEEQYYIYLDKYDYLWGIGEAGIFKMSVITGEVYDLPRISEKLDVDKIFSFLGFLPGSDQLLMSTNDSVWGYNVNTEEFSLLYKQSGILGTEWAYVDSWAIDRNNTLWLGFSSVGIVGLSLPDFEQKYFYHKGNSIIDNNIYGVMADADGDVWFSSHSGIFVLDSDSHHIQNYTVEDGLPAMEFNSGAYTVMKNGELVYGSMIGVSIFDPIALKNNDSADIEQVKVTQIKVLSREMSLPLVIDNKSILEFNYDDVGLRFDFSPLSYKNINKLIYQYRLLGDKTVEYPPTSKNEITFPSLPSGKHALEVRIKSPITGEYSAATRLNLQVSYAPWASPLAYMLYTIVVLALLIYWYLRRAAQQRILLDAHDQVKYRENRLQLALTGSNSEVWDWQAHNNLMFGKRITDELGYTDFADSYPFSEHIQFIHPDDKDSFLSNWQNYLQHGDQTDNFSCNYRMKNSEGKWLWFKDLGKVVAVDGEGNPTRITGSYTNITQARVDEERAQYYGDAFRQTKDWVLIISDNFEKVTANQSLRDVFGWEDEEFEFTTSLLGLDKERRQFYQQLLSSLGENSHWRGEELISSKAGEEYHVIVNINVSKNVNNNSLHYICVFTDITAQKAAEKELRYLANYDFLTDLPNRSLLLDRIKHALDYSKRKSTSIALFFIDLDRFKQINDSLGHDYGDLLLKEVTLRLTGVLRIDDTVARIGGDEFVVLLESFRGNGQLAQIAQKIIDVIGQPVTLNDNVVSVGASIGIALYPDDATNSDELLRNSDVAMYHAKQLGRNTFQFFTQRMNYEASERLQKESRLKLAYANDEFINYYQPIVDANIGKAVGVELLLRWQSNGKIVPPMEFISVAEELNLIIPMTEAALERGLRDLKIWRKLRPELYLSINLSAQHFLKESLLPFVAKMLEKYDLPANSVKMEVTESALISEPQKAIKTMNALADLGIKLALDDFGTGYSSLTYLKQLPLDIIKIDRSFVFGIGHDKTNEAIVDATLVLAKRLGMHCIAEGVETKDQLRYLIARECHYIQGYLYSKPVDFQTIQTYLEEDMLELMASQL